MKTLVSRYRDAREPRLIYGQFITTPATQALRTARAEIRHETIKDAFEAMGGLIVDECDKDRDTEGAGVRIVAHPDFDHSIDDLCGDCFSPECNRDINPNILKRERREFVDRVEREGVWGYCAEYFDGAEWIETDSIWGFVADDFGGSGYDDDLMQSAIDERNAVLKAQARDWESTRPDLYRQPAA